MSTVPMTNILSHIVPNIQHGPEKLKEPRERRMGFGAVGHWFPVASSTWQMRGNGIAGCRCGWFPVASSTWQASGDKRSNTDDDDRQGGLSTVVDPKTKTQTKKPKLYKVILHNDNYTTMEFVVHVLQKVFHKNHAEAMHLMLYVHHKGRAIIGLYTFDIAETKVKQVLDLAHEQGYPLLCTMEPE